MNDTLFAKIVKYHHTVTANTWKRFNSAICSCPRMGIANYLYPLGASRPEDGSEAFTQDQQVEACRTLGKITGGVF